MGKRIVIAVLLASTLSAQAAMTLSSREMFQGVGAYDSGSPGANFSSVSGTLFKRPGGPRLSSDTVGYSADLRQAYSTWGALPSPGGTRIFVGAWVFTRGITASGANEQPIIWFHTAAGNRPIRIGLLNQTIFSGQETATGTTGTNLPVSPFNQWVFLGIAARQVSGNNWDARFYYKEVGGSLTQWNQWTNRNQGVSSWASLRVGQSAASGPKLNGRIGGACVYTFSQDDFSDIAYPSDLIEPSIQMNWYLDTTNGSDSGDGISPGSAWKTKEKLQTELDNCGILSAHTYTSGDTVWINTATTPLDLLGVPLAINTAGINVKSAGPTWITVKAHATIQPSEWIEAANCPPKIYSTTNTVSLGVLWEDDKWLTHANGSTLASVTNALYTTAGSFWTDGTLMYVHPFGDTDPRSDGKTYDRSTSVSATGAVILGSTNQYVQDLFIRKTADAAAATGTSNAGYAIGTTTPFGGTNVIAHCYVDYTGKHGFGLVANGSNGDVTILSDCQSEQGTPYAGPGGQTPFVSYTGSATVTNIQHLFINPTCIKSTGVVGSTNGIAGAHGVFYTHNASGSNQFSLISFEGASFGENLMETGNSVAKVTIDRSTFGGLPVSGALTNIVTRSLITKRPPSGVGNTYQNCILALTNSAYNGMGNFSGGNTIEGCVLDYRAISGSGTNIITRTNTSTFIFRNNVVLLPAAGLNVFANFANTDSLTIDGNVYHLGSFSRLSASYNDGSTTANRTLSQWQALGFDTSSVNQDPCLDSRYRPYAKTPCWNVGADLGALTDYTGKLFQSRKTVGAFEYAPTLLRAIDL